MNAPDRAIGWPEANQQRMVAEFDRLRALLGEADGSACGAAVEALRAEMPAPAAIDVLARVFKLSGFERDLLLLAAGVEMDARIAALCARAAGAPSRPWASFGLALAALPDPHWSALAPSGPLRHWRLIELDESAGLTTTRLRIDERVLHLLGGLNTLDARLAPLVQPVPAPGPMSGPQHATVLRVVAQLRAASGRLPPVWLAGDDAGGQQDVAAAIAARLGIALHRLRGVDLPAAAGEQAALALLWAREAALGGAGLLITADDESEGSRAADALAAFVQRTDGLVIVAGRAPGECGAAVLHHGVDRPGVPERRRLWAAALGPHAAALAPVLDTLAAQYRLGARRIGEIGAEAAAGGAAPDAERLHRACRGDAAAMPGLAQPIEPRASWQDLVLPAAQLQALQQIAVHARHRLKVHHDWGFAGKGARGLGIATLFWGDSGTGKTLAAEVLADELGLALYRIDLSAVVSKYIGETEKNLRRLFDAAEDSGAILLFDEADALFGKRSEVKDSHDRYANIEVSYLLQRMEEFSGLAILTSNHKAALDGAFQRRLRFVVHFPFPDRAQRADIWRAVFPSETPLHGIDWARLAQLNVAGGTIRNIALSAAFFAAEAGGPVGMAELLRAAHLEAAKQDRPHSDVETRGWV